MPVRSSVCTYSPTSVSNSKYSTPSSLSIGHYKPLHSTSSSSYASSSSGRGSSALGSLTSGSSRGYSSYSPSQSTFSSSLSSPSSSSSSSYYSPTSSASSTTSSTSGGHYRPLASTHNSFSTGSPSRYGATTTTNLGPSSTGSYASRYSWASSTGSASSASSLSSAGSCLTDRLSDATVSPYSSSYISGSHHQRPTSSSSSRRLSYTSTTSPTESLPSGVPRGLINLGNTCYMNAVIEALYSIDSIKKLILRASHDKTLTSELSNLFKSMKNSSSPVSPANFKYAFSRHQAKFSGLGQQDAQEFLRYLINGIHEEFNETTRRSRRSGLTAPRCPKTASEAWRQYRDIVDDSPLVDLVVGQMCSTIVCSVCQNKSHCWDPFWDLSLPLTRGRYSVKLSDVVQDFIAEEVLDADERPVCSNCERATRSTKQIHLCRLPPVIILHLKKFTNDGYKLSSPEVAIDRVLKFKDVDGGASYDLAACISHHGHSSSSGHYTCHCRYSSSWFHFNDDRVRDVTSSFDSVKLNDAYVLFYTQSAPPGKPSVLNQSKL